MPILSDEHITMTAIRRAKFRVKTAGTKLNIEELAAFEKHCRERGTIPGELIRRLILQEMNAGPHNAPVSPELVEIVGIRLMLSNFLTPIATGQKLTPEIAEQVLSETRKRKRGVAVELSREVEGR